MTYGIEEICRMAGENVELIKPQGAEAPKVRELLIDSRSLLRSNGVLFWALHTNRDDGARFIGELYTRGVRMFAVNRDFTRFSEFPEGWFLVMDDTVKGLCELGKKCRKAVKCPVVGITGSAGKTMVKEWIYQLLKGRTHVARSPRSFNSQLGVPLSLWLLDEATDVALIEAGVSERGDMEPLEEMIAPDIAVLTSIGSQHSDGFDSVDEKIAEKLRLARRARVLVAPMGDAAVAAGVESALREGRLPEGISIIDSGAYTGIVTGGELTDWERCNMATSLAVCDALGFASESVKDSASHLHTVGTRLNVSEGVNNCLLITDSYTSDLHSLVPALDFMARRSTADRSMTLIMTDLDTETAATADSYEAVASLCRLRGIRRVIGIGEEFSRHAELFPEGSRMFTDVEEAMRHLGTTDFDHELIMVKGAPEYGLDRLVRKLEARTHETVLEVNLDAMTSNYNFYRSKLRPTTGLVAMVKASGYGAGSYELAKTLQSIGAAYLAVAVLDEGIDLRKAGITMPIMVLNPKVLNYRLLFSNNLEPEIFSIDILEEIIDNARRLGVKNYPVHIKLDTGMHRLGFLEEDIDRVLSILRGQDGIRVRSVFSHLATADCPDMNDYTEMQLEKFTRWSGMIADGLDYPILRHVLNTAGIMRYPEYQFDMVRLGIGLYGVPVLNDGSESELRPVSTLRTVIIAVKEWDEGITVGYGRRGVLKRHSKVATIPVGYADGINRHMGRGNVAFLVNGVKCPTIGNICMDVCMIDVTDVPDVKVGDSVEIFGENNHVGLLAEALDTIPYELLTSVSPRVRRVYYTE